MDIKLKEGGSFNVLDHNGKALLNAVDGKGNIVFDGALEIETEEHGYYYYVVSPNASGVYKLVSGEDVVGVLIYSYDDGCFTALIVEDLGTKKNSTYMGVEVTISTTGEEDEFQCRFDAYATDRFNQQFTSEFQYDELPSDEVEALASGKYTSAYLYDKIFNVSPIDKSILTLFKLSGEEQNIKMVTYELTADSGWQLTSDNSYYLNSFAPKQLAFDGEVRLTYPGTNTIPAEDALKIWNVMQGASGSGYHAFRLKSSGGLSGYPWPIMFVSGSGSSFVCYFFSTEINKYNQGGSIKEFASASISAEPTEGITFPNSYDIAIPPYGNGNQSWDATPTAGSTKPVTSGGIYTALAGKVSFDGELAVTHPGSSYLIACPEKSGVYRCTGMLTQYIAIASGPHQPGNVYGVVLIGCLENGMSMYYGKGSSGTIALSGYNNATKLYFHDIFCETDEDMEGNITFISTDPTPISASNVIDKLVDNFSKIMHPIFNGGMESVANETIFKIDNEGIASGYFKVSYLKPGTAPAMEFEYQIITVSSIEDGVTEL